MARRTGTASPTSAMATREATTNRTQRSTTTVFGTPSSRHDQACTASRTYVGAARKLSTPVCRARRGLQRRRDVRGGGKEQAPAGLPYVQRRPQTGAACGVQARPGGGNHTERPWGGGRNGFLHVEQGRALNRSTQVGTTRTQPSHHHSAGP